MRETFKKILVDREWNETRMEDILENIQTRLGRRLPPGTPLTLTKFQRQAIADPKFWRDWSVNADVRHLMIQGATSAGKTLLSELNILDTQYHQKKAIVLVPLKAMVHERTEQFRRDMEHGNEKFGITVYGASGDYMENDERLINGDYQVAIIVYEKFFAMLSQGSSKIMNDCGLLVVDELSMLSQEQRGPKLEMALEIVRGKYPDTRIMCMATCDCSTERVCKWLDIDEPIISTARPVALEEHIILSDGASYGEGVYRVIPADHDSLQEEAPERLEEKIIVPGYHSEWRQNQKEQQLLLEVLRRIFTENPEARLLVFVNSQSRASYIADFLKNEASEWFPPILGSATPRQNEFLHKVKACDRDDGQEKLMDDLIPHGIAYHHASISTTLRELIEEEFQQPDSMLKVIVATETLTVGVNMPFDAMIMLSNLVYHGLGDPIPLTGQEYRNYIGRAGRLGQSMRRGVTYLLVEKKSYLDFYWKSYYERAEIMSSLVKAPESVLAPYYLSLLNNQVGTTDDVGTSYTLDQLNRLYQSSLTRACGNRDHFSARELYDCLYDAYLSSEVKTHQGGHGGRGRRAKATESYAIERFGKHMAPYSFSLDTCIRIYCDFYEGYNNGGLPLGITQEDVSSDRYLLDILYHVCRHKEIAHSSNLRYPVDDSNVSRSYKAKDCVLRQLRKILSETDETGNPRHLLWCDGLEQEQKEENDIWQLLNRSNLQDEPVMLQTAMRAVLLFYWTKGLTLDQIVKETGFRTFTKVVNGDIERLAEVASFHLDAIYKCLSTASDPESGRRVCETTEALIEFYMLQTRVKYGMPRDLVQLANKHVHGLDRARLLRVKAQADRLNLSPVQFLYVASARDLNKNLTASQQTLLKQALERRGSVQESGTLLEIVSKDAGAGLSDDTLDCLRMLADWDGSDAYDVYDNVKSIVCTEALQDVSVSTDGIASQMIWRLGDTTLHIGILDAQQAEMLASQQSPKPHRRLLNFFDTPCDGRILVFPRKADIRQPEEVLQACHADVMVDNIYFTFVLANTIRLKLDRGYALTEFLADIRGVFTKSDYRFFPLPHYLDPRQDQPDGTQPLFRFLSTSDMEENLDDTLTANELAQALAATEDLRDFEVLHWGQSLTDESRSYVDMPTVIMLERSDVVCSESLNRFMYKMLNQSFRNCLLVVPSEQVWAEWVDTAAQTPGNQWRADYSRIRHVIAGDADTAVTRIRNFLAEWRHPTYLIGISYAHYNRRPRDKTQKWDNDIQKLERLAELLKNEFGEDRIMFDQFSPAKELFGKYRAAEASLDAYSGCRLFLIQWNSWTKDNINCIDERYVIERCCREGNATTIFLTTYETGLPVYPPNFAQSLDGDLQDILREIRQRLRPFLT